jgi:Family of unknown function (DUF6884)
MTRSESERLDTGDGDPMRLGEPASITRDVLLVTCVKTKQQYPCAAKDLYISALFKKQRSYAEKCNVPWFILSAEHGLVAPDEWLAPYERYLPDTPARYRNAWAAWVVARLELLIGPLFGKIIEIHAGADYLGVIRSQLDTRGAIVIDPLNKLTHGQRLAWYGTAEPLRQMGELSQNELLNDLNVKRSAFVCALLAQFPDVVVRSTRPTVLELVSRDDR